MRSTLLSLLPGAAAVMLACSTGGGSSSGSTAAEGGGAGEGAVAVAMAMPRAGEYVAINEARYGHYEGAPGAPAQGEAAPDFELPTHEGGSLRLSEALAEGPVVLMFYRGFW